MWVYRDETEVLSSRPKTFEKKKHFKNVRKDSRLFSSYMLKNFLVNILYKYINNIPTNK